MTLKQVIVVRNDLNMRKGKMIAQGAHASCMSILVSRFSSATVIPWLYEWFMSGMMKICVRCDSEAELLLIESKAREAGLTVYLITDAGHTEFAGVPTKTCLCIGPNLSEEIDKITGALKLL